MGDSSAVLKRPTGVYILAVLFILAPLGNILISFAGSGVQNWYEPQVFIPFLQTIPVLDWLWLGLLVLTGVLLFRPHKLSWTIAIISLLIVMGVNSYRIWQVDQNSIDPHFLKVFSIIALFCTLGVLVIAAYFRFPYIDRRAQWTSSEPNPDRRDEARDEAPKGRRKSK